VKPGPDVGRPRGRAFTTLIVAAAAVRLAIAWAPGEWLLRRVLGDDPFYYFTIARRFAHGRGLTFDGSQPTNGFHPLWLFLVAPIFGAVRDVWLAIHVALTFAAALDLLTVILFVRLLRELDVGRGVRLGVTALYAFSPLLASPAGPLNGLETALNLLAIVTLLICYRRQAEEAAAGRASVALGVSAGFAFLARTDNAILLAFVFGALLWRARADRRRLLGIASAASLAAGIAAPWLAWSWSRFGSPIQVSGLAAAHVARVLAKSQGWTGLDYAVKLARNLATLAAYAPVGRRTATTLAGRAVANAAFVAVLLISAVRHARTAPSAERRAWQARLRPWWSLLAAGVVFIAVHTWRAVDLRSWYYTSLVPVVLVTLALVADFIARCSRLRSPSGARRAGVAAAVTLLAILTAGWRVGLAGRCGEMSRYQAVGAVNEALPPGTRLGAWNAGLVGYFYQRGQVVDLDGLVDNAAYRHIVDRSLGAYVAGREIQYLLDADGIASFWQPYWDGGRPLSFPIAVWKTSVPAACRQMSLIPVPGREARPR
jgi:hypothetical protein